MKNTHYKDVCVWPGVLIGDSPSEAVEDWFMNAHGVRVTDVEEVQTLVILSDGTYRNDVVFRMHSDDVKSFKSRKALGIFLWEDWIKHHEDDYAVVQIERYS